MARPFVHKQKIMELALTDQGTTAQDVAEQTGLSLDGARDALNRMVALKLLTVERRPLRGGPKVYRGV